MKEIKIVEVVLAILSIGGFVIGTRNYIKPEIYYRLLFRSKIIKLLTLTTPRELFKEDEYKKMPKDELLIKIKRDGFFTILFSLFLFGILTYFHFFILQ